jgi:hypothetical protein
MTCNSSEKKWRIHSNSYQVQRHLFELQFLFLLSFRAVEICRLLFVFLCCRCKTIYKSEASLRLLFLCTALSVKYVLSHDMNVALLILSISVLYLIQWRLVLNCTHNSLTYTHIIHTHTSLISHTVHIAETIQLLLSILLFSIFFSQNAYLLSSSTPPPVPSFLLALNTLLLLLTPLSTHFRRGIGRLGCVDRGQGG